VRIARLVAVPEVGYEWARTGSTMKKPATIRPLIGVTACLKERDGFAFHSVGERYVDAVIDGTDGIPALIPAIGGRQRTDELLDRLDGVMLTGSPSNIDPSYYGGAPASEDNLADPARDATTLPLVCRALEMGVPLLAICRGIQELNVALGGSLHQHLEELPGHRDHRSDKSRAPQDRYGPAHTIDIVPGGSLQEILGGAASIEVNSLHGQGIDRLADRLTIEAVAADGTIEAVSVRDAPGFALGVQWHPEWRIALNPWSLRLFAAFADAARMRAAARELHAGVSRVA
jgi:putative glutamine amidotransferase